MKSFEYIVTDDLGIHARPCGLLVQEAKKYDSEITIRGNGRQADMKHLFAVMGMGIRKDHRIEVTAEGSDEEIAASALKSFLQAIL